ncbi:predicted HD superfamily hydrolase [Longilinea arvoryzae]|uniref:Predicted HD superfamily hydrolase n=1 Tax=Longilinea arvoryzae TaxID=360412 RepID=A0A0S7BCF9_9CHLR|nr:HD domain-containing protein [Longilinea arvoryzae]GAP12957.1 predicted HD superfamily hydrolase [Longilinea arvoryzae]
MLEWKEAVMIGKTLRRCSICQRYTAAYLVEDPHLGTLHLCHACWTAHQESVNAAAHSTGVPGRAQAEALLAEGESLNPGPWVGHSRWVAEAAIRLAAHLPGLDPDTAFSLGLLHDIGRREGPSDMRHALDGYRYLSGLGYGQAAQICLTHSHPIRNIHAAAGQWDIPPEEFRFVQTYLERVDYKDYDRLIQLCDALALPDGLCLIEKRLVDVALRHGFNEYTLDKWRAFLQLQRDFERILGQSVYTFLPRVIENTFGVNSSHKI